MSLLNTKGIDNMYYLTYTRGTMIFRNENVVMIEQPFRPAVGEEQSRPWANSQEALEFWALIKPSFIGDDVPDEDIEVTIEE